jgi:hypothetical protein
VVGAFACGAGGKFFGERGFFGVVDWCGVAGAGIGCDASFVDVAVDDTRGVGPFDPAAVSLGVAWPLSVTAAAVGVPSLTGEGSGGTVGGGAVVDTAGVGELDIGDG